MPNWVSPSQQRMAQNLLERERTKWAATQADVLSSLSTEQLASAVAEVDTKHVKAVAELDARQIRAMAELEAKQRRRAARADPDRGASQ